MAVRRLAGPELASAVRAKVDAQAAAGRFQGAVLAARNGKVLYSDAKGLATGRATRSTARHALPHGIDEQDVHRTAIMQLVQAGRVRLDAPLGST